MKLTTVLLAIASAAVLSTAASAQTTSTNGDVIIGFFDANGTVTNDLEVNLGSIQTLGAATTPLTFNLGYDLTAVYGSNFSNTSGSTNVTWGVAAAYPYGYSSTLTAPFTRRSIFLSQAESTPGTLAAPLPANSGLSLPIANVNALYNGSASGGFTGNPVFTSAGNPTVYDAASIANNSTSTPSIFQQEVVNGGAGFGIGASGVGNGVLNNFANGLSSSVSDFEYLTNASGNPSSVLGVFSWTGSGTGATLVYTPIATPEPSAYALGVVALALLLVLKRRNSIV